MSNDGKLYVNDQKVIACAQNLDEVLKVSQKLEMLLKMYYEEERILHPEKAQILFRTLETVRKERDITLKKKTFLENLVWDIQRIRTSANQTMDYYEAIWKGLIEE